MQRIESEGCRPINKSETLNHLGGRGLNGALVYIGTRKVEHTERRLRLYVNGKRGHTWYITITVSASDLYFDDLKQAVEELYDTAIRVFNDGWIPL
jgi:hypothetical protein